MAFVSCFLFPKNYPFTCRLGWDNSHQMKCSMYTVPSSHNKSMNVGAQNGCKLDIGIIFVRRLICCSWSLPILSRTVMKKICFLIAARASCLNKGQMEIKLKQMYVITWRTFQRARAIFHFTVSLIHVAHYEDTLCAVCCANHLFSPRFIYNQPHFFRSFVIIIGS